MTTASLPAAAALLAELDQESQATRSVLAALPADKLGWKPHPRSLSLGEQAQHVADIPGRLAEMLGQDHFDFADGQGFSEASSSEALLHDFDASLATARHALQNWSAEELASEWKVAKEGKHLMSLPRSAALRSFLFNHLYHHRGQLTVYLRLLDVPVPSVYGPTADVDPFESA